MDFCLPIPRNWQDFESICHQLWKEIWSDPNAQRNGRSGQPQHGIDIFGRPIYSRGYAGVQCKDKDSNLGSTLGQNELVAECEKAKEFRPLLDTFSVATTAPREAAIQESARMLTDKERFPFGVHVWSWDDIEAEITSRPVLLAKYYPTLLSPDRTPVAKIAASSPREQFYAFFSRPRVRGALAPRLREYLIPLAYELSDNAFIHGRASSFELSFDGTLFRLEDNGAEFDPLSRLHHEKGTTEGRIGSFVLEAFRGTFSDAVEMTYSRVERNQAPSNRMEIRFKRPPDQLGTVEVCDVMVDLSLAYGRRGADRLALDIAIPQGIKELVLTVGDVHNISAFVEFVKCVLRRLPEGVSLVVSVPRSDLLANVVKWFDDPRLSFRPR